MLTAEEILNRARYIRLFRTFFPDRRQAVKDTPLDDDVLMRAVVLEFIRLTDERLFELDVDSLMIHDLDEQELNIGWLVTHIPFPALLGVDWSEDFDWYNYHSPYRLPFEVIEEADGPEAIDPNNCPYNLPKLKRLCRRAPVPLRYLQYAVEMNWNITGNNLFDYSTEMLYNSELPTADPAIIRDIARMYRQARGVLDKILMLRLWLDESAENTIRAKSLLHQCYEPS